MRVSQRRVKLSWDQKSVLVPHKLVVLSSEGNTTSRYEKGAERVKRKPLHSGGGPGREWWKMRHLTKQQDNELCLNDLIRSSIPFSSGLMRSRNSAQCPQPLPWVEADSSMLFFPGCITRVFPSTAHLPLPCPRAQP